MGGEVADHGDFAFDPSQSVGAGGDAPVDEVLDQRSGPGRQGLGEPHRTVLGEELGGVDPGGVGPRPLSAASVR